MGCAHHGTDICSNRKVTLPKYQPTLHFKAKSASRRCLPKDISKSSSGSPLPKRCLGADAKRGKALLGKSQGFRSRAPAGAGLLLLRAAPLPAPCLTLNSALAPRPQSAVPRGCGERGTRGAYLRLGPASALPAPAIGWQHGPQGTRQSAAPALAPRPGRRPAAPRSPTCASGRGGRAAVFTEEAVRGGRSGAGVGRAGRTGRSWPPPGAALAGQRRRPVGWSVRGSLGPGRLRVLCRCAQGTREAGPRRHLLVAARGRGRKLVLLDCPRSPGDGRDPGGV